MGRRKKEITHNFLAECGEFVFFKSGKSVFVCSFCNVSVESMTLFATHIKSEHDDKLLKYNLESELQLEKEKQNVQKKKELIVVVEEAPSQPSDSFTITELDTEPASSTSYLNNEEKTNSEQIDFKPNINLEELVVVDPVQQQQQHIYEPQKEDAVKESIFKESAVKVEVKIEREDEDSVKNATKTDQKNSIELEQLNESIYKNLSGGEDNDDDDDDQDFSNCDVENNSSDCSDNYENILEVQISEKLQNDKHVKLEDYQLELKTEDNEAHSETKIGILCKETEVEDDKSGIRLPQKKTGWIREKNEFGDYVCQLCGNTYKKGSSLSRHRVLCLKRGGVSIPRRGGINRTKNTNGMYACNHCGKEFDSTLLLSAHEKVHRDEKLKEAKQCEICGKHLHSSSSLREHLLRHTGETPYKCSQCPRGFYNKYTLQTHEKIHLPEKEYPCDQCDKKFSRPPDLRRHVRYVHLNERPAPVMCDLCGKSFTFQFNLKYHMRRHLNVKPVKCDLCDMTFVEKGDLNKHKITHNPDFKPYQCEVCSVSFSRKITLTKHQKLHTGLKEYICKICGKAFAQSPGLYMHMKSHGFNKKPEGAGYYERQSHLMYRNMSSRTTD